MAKGVKTGGRKKGSANKTTTAVKEALIEAFEEIGGIDSLVSWGRLNETEFYKLWVKVLPQEINANLSGEVDLNARVTIYMPDNGRDGNQPKDGN